MDYQQTLAFLASLVDYERFRPRRYDAETYDLDRFREVLQRLGEPQQTYPIIHVVGSKGKGSTTATAASILRAAGIRAGAFFSPHLQTVRERITVDGAEIPPTDFAAAVTAAREAMGDPPPGIFRTYFETLCAAAFWYFRERGVECAVVEAGLGGRLDATNVVTPRAVAITTLDLEHTDVLGTSLTAIAGEKGAVMKAGVPAVSAPQPPEAEAALQTTARRVGAPLRFVREGVDFLPAADGSFEYLAGGPPIADIRPGIPGRAQVTNAALAIAATLTLSEYRTPPEAIRAGVAGTRLAGRLQLFPGHPLYIVDTAHSPASARNLTSYLGTVGRSPRILIWGMARDKDQAAFAAEVAPAVDAVVVTAARHPRSLSPPELAAVADRFFPKVETADVVEEALARGRRLAGRDGLVCVAGSFYVAGEALNALAGPKE